MRAAAAEPGEDVLPNSQSGHELLACHATATLRHGNDGWDHRAAAVLPPRGQVVVVENVREDTVGEGSHDGRHLATEAEDRGLRSPAALGCHLDGTPSGWLEPTSG
jgi:hypothetical protein